MRRLFTVKLLLLSFFIVFLSMSSFAQTNQTNISLPKPNPTPLTTTQPQLATSLPTATPLPSPSPQNVIPTTYEITGIAA